MFRELKKLLQKLFSGLCHSLLTGTSGTSSRVGTIPCVGDGLLDIHGTNYHFQNLLEFVDVNAAVGVCCLHQQAKSL